MHKSQLHSPIHHFIGATKCGKTEGAVKEAIPDSRRSRSGAQILQRIPKRDEIDGINFAQCDGLCCIARRLR